MGSSTILSISKMRFIPSTSIIWAVHEETFRIHKTLHNPMKAPKLSLPEQLEKHCVGIYLLGLVVILAGILFSGWANTWELLGINTMAPPFADMRHVQGALQTLSEGIDPRLSNPHDPWLRPLNYPLIWVHIFRYLSLDNEKYFMIFCTTMIGVYVLTSASLLYRHPSIPLLLILLSNSTLLAIERGNNDLLIFSLIYLFAISIKKEKLSTIFLIIAASLKIYPVCTLATNFILKRYRSLLIAATIIIIGFYFFHNDLFLIQTNNPTMIGKGYGLPSTIYILKGHSEAILCFLFSFFTLLIAASATPIKLQDASDAHAEKYVLFLIGASLYCGTYLLSSNWDYRMIFLAFCIPHAMTENNKKFGALILSTFIAANAANLSNVTFIIYSIFENLSAVDEGSHHLYEIFWTTADQSIKLVIFLICGGTLTRQAIDSLPRKIL